MTRETPAKVNLFLEVRGRRPDGYHEIRTVFLPLSGLSDTVTVQDRPDAGLHVRCDHPDVPNGEHNLAYRAATAFFRHTGQSRGCTLAIEKRIPVAAGLGGGSADAAAVLLLLNEIAPRPLGFADLALLAADIGADVPFFLTPRPAVGTGTGTTLTPFDLQADFGVVLVNPRFPVRAAWAYQALHHAAPPPLPRFADFAHAAAAGDFSGMAACTCNALEFAVLHKFPLVRMIVSHLREAGCEAAHVTGSGPTVYGLCPPGLADAVRAGAQQAFGESVWTWAGFPAPGHSL